MRSRKFANINTIGPCGGDSTMTQVTVTVGNHTDAITVYGETNEEAVRRAIAVCDGLIDGQRTQRNLT